MISLRLLNIRRYTTPANGRLAQLPKAYNPNDFEAKIAKKWIGRNKLSLTNLDDNNTFRMIFPPPNVTGKLHLGHALTVAIQDTIVRLKLMRGQNVEWIPGFDHAGIATHTVVTRKFSNSGKKIEKSMLRTELANHALTNRENIKHQLDAMGALLDWDKEYYTLDENHSYVVKEAFMQLFDNDVICRGEGLVNWCFALQSSVADIEVEEVEFKGRSSFKIPGYPNCVEFGLLYHCAYPLQNTDVKLVVATSRPETMFGDVAIAINPGDVKNQEFIGKFVINPINGKLIPVIGDSRVKSNFATGLVKITPAHDKLDFEIGTDNNLPFVKVFQRDGTMNENCGEFKGKLRYEARQDVIQCLKDSGALVEVTEYNGSMGICSRTQDVIEPLLFPHWFFRTKELSDKLISFIHNGDFVIRPENMEHVFLQKMSSVHDWCLSRQIEWGHPIPAYHHQEFPDQWVSASSKSAAKNKLENKLQIQIQNEDEVKQDTDVLDTWFSSALIPLALSNWPDVEEIKELNLMETGHDILFFWVWRMAIMNLALTGKLPFRSVLLHGIVIDHYGRKMSKSRGNVIDPMHVIDGRTIEQLNAEAAESLKLGDLEQNEYELRLFALGKDYASGLPSCGADALRFALLGQDIYDQDVTISVTYLENCKHFCNKVYQALRLYLHYAEAEESHQIDHLQPFTPAQFSALPIMDLWILTSLHDFVTIYEMNIRSCKFHVVTEAIRTFFYQKYCDVYLEFAKFELKQKLNVQQHLQVMYYVLCSSIKLAHPFLPFVTEEIWSILTEDKGGLLIDSRQPVVNELVRFRNDVICQRIERMLKLIKQVRSFKLRYFPNTKESPVLLLEIHKDDMDLIEIETYVEHLCKVKVKFDILGRNPMSDSLCVIFDLEGGRSCRISCSRSDIGVVIPAITETNLLKLQTKLAKLKKQYDNPVFQHRAPDDVKQKLRRKVELLESRIEEANSSPKQPTDSNTS